jgi:hypothetical protein
VRCLRAAQEVRAVLDALEVAIAPPAPWPTRARRGVRRGIAAAARGSARALRRGIPARDIAADARRAPSSEFSA